MLNLRQIYQGWKNLIFENPEIEKLAKERALVCAKCPIRTDEVCDKSKGGCGCPLVAKWRSPKSKCPTGRWNK